MEFPGHEYRDENEDVLSLLEAHWHHIRTHAHRRHCRLQDQYTLRTPFEGGRLNSFFEAIFRDQTTCFKINVSIAFVLYSGLDDEYKFFYASNNSSIFEKTRLVRNRTDMRALVDDLHRIDMLEWAKQQRSNSRWVVHALTNVCVYVNRIPDHPIGGLKSVMPAYLLRNRYVECLDRDGNSGKPFADNLCFFRCVVRFKGAPKRALKAPTAKLFAEYRRKFDIEESAEDFDGIRLTDLGRMEHWLNLDITVYSIDAKGVAVMIRRATDRDRASRKRPKIMYLNLHERHFSWISSLPQCVKSWCCDRCGKMFKRRHDYIRHQNTCKGAVRYVYPGGVFNPKPSIFETLRSDWGVVPERFEDGFFPFFATFDFESYFPDGGAAHQILSVSVASNVPGWTRPVCHVNDSDNPAAIVELMLKTLYGISRSAEEAVTHTLRRTFELLDKLAVGCELETVNGLTSRLLDWTKQLPVLGFNSAKYDLNLIRRYLIPLLKDGNKFQDKLRYTLKTEANKFTAITTERLKFLDMRSYLAANYNYAAFVKAYGAEGSKGCFPYEYMTSLDRLADRQLPPKAAFHSNLNDTDITDEQYEQCLRTWRVLGMKTLRDYLVHYNNKDVVPFVEAADNMRLFYMNDMRVDVFKDAVSVPGLTLKILFASVTDPGAKFWLFDEKDKDLHTTIRNNIVGGPSIIFHRYHEAGVTKIRELELGEAALPCRRIVGYDANALYLWALMQDMPTGMYVRRHESTQFEAVHPPGTGKLANEWLRWCEAKHPKLKFRHRYNGSERRVGKYFVDGFVEGTNLVLEFNGCFWHGHENCEITEGIEYNGRQGITMKQCSRNTADRKLEIEKAGYVVHVKTECEWKRDKINDPRIIEFLRREVWTGLHERRRLPGGVPEIVEAVLSGALFGLVECDIAVPDALKAAFADMPPIFKNVDIDLADIGTYMQRHAEIHKLSKKSRKGLIGSYFGIKILLTTALLRWYLEHGLVVSRVYQIAEYKPRACFVPFGNKVSDCRRLGDVNPDHAIVAETMKLIGNSAYGKTVTNQFRFKSVEYAREDSARRSISDPRFCKLECLDPLTAAEADPYYEVTSHKRVVRLDLPLHVGFSVYQSAKLHMLGFRYDFVGKYVPRNHFQYVEMDTDSAYIGLAFESLEAAVREADREAFDREKYKWLPRPDNVHDRREPGRFKEEWRGDGFIGLCSKTYYCFGRSHGHKVSCKGLQKARNALTATHFLDVLRTQRSHKGTNRGFRMKDGVMTTYEQDRTALTYFYPKRKVQEDGVTTLPLDI